MNPSSGTTGLWQVSVNAFDNDVYRPGINQNNCPKTTTGSRSGIDNPCCQAYIANAILEDTCSAAPSSLSYIGNPITQAPPFCEGQWTGSYSVYSAYAGQVCRNDRSPSSPSASKKSKKSKSKKSMSSKGKKGKKVRGCGEERSEEKSDELEMS